jgi:hypothetical protein
MLQSLKWIGWNVERIVDGEKGRSTPRSFRIQDRVEADIKIEERVFWKMVSDILLVLGERHDATAKRHRQQMAKLEEDAWKPPTPNETSARAWRVLQGFRMQVV